MLYQLSDLSKEISLSLSGEMVDLFITADSRTGLFIQDNSRKLSIFDFQKKTILTVDLSDIN